MYKSDSNEDIQRCLNCKHARCIDCLSRTPRVSARAQKITVQQINSTTGEIIATYDSLTHAQMITGISRTSISQCIRGNSSHAGGYYWKEIKAHV